MAVRPIAIRDGSRGNLLGRAHGRGGRHRVLAYRREAGRRLAPRRSELHRPEPATRPENRERLCRRLCRVQSRQAIRGQFLRQGLSRRSDQAAQAASGGIGNRAARLRRARENCAGDG